MADQPSVFVDFYGGDNSHYLITLKPPFTDKNLAVLFGTVFEAIIRSEIPVLALCPAGQITISGVEKARIFDESIDVQSHDVQTCGKHGMVELEEDADEKLEKWVLGQVKEELATRKADFDS